MSGNSSEERNQKRLIAHFPTHHSTPKGKVHFPPVNLPEENRENSGIVEVYLRCASKKAIKMLVPSNTPLTEIKATIEKRFGVESGKQLLHLNGKNITEYTHIHLQSNNIIHVSDKEHLLKSTETIQAKVNIIDSFSGNAKQERNYSINGNEKTQKLIDKIRLDIGIKGKDRQSGSPFYFLLQSSRLLDQERTFHDQQISQNANIICLITKNQLKTKFLNDTKEDILHDISALLQQDTHNKLEAKKPEQTNVSLDYAKEGEEVEEVVVFDASSDQGEFKRPRKQSIRSNEEVQENQIQQKNEDSISISFKKKTSKKLEANEDRERPLLKKIKANKSKRQLDQLLKTNGKDNIFYNQDAIIDKKKERQIKRNSSRQQDVELHKPVKVIPKVMPAEQRRKIKNQMQRLFDVEPKQSQPPSKPPTIQQQLPKSPPTQEPPRIQKRKQKMQKLRFSMGSRPAFLNSLKASLKNDTP